MKTRLGFVSNSSSSSFIFAVDKNTMLKNKDLNVEIKLKIPLKELITNTFESGDDYINYIIHEYCSFNSKKQALNDLAKNPKSDMAKVYNFIANNPNASVYEVTVCSDEGGISSILHENPSAINEINKNNGFTVLSN